jgi:hypothetical protein
VRTSALACRLLLAPASSPHAACVPGIGLLNRTLKRRADGMRFNSSAGQIRGQKSKVRKSEVRSQILSPILTSDLCSLTSGLGFLTEETNPFAIAFGPECGGIDLTGELTAMA